LLLLLPASRNATQERPPTIIITIAAITIAATATAPGVGSEGGVVCDHHHRFHTGREVGHDRVGVQAAWVLRAAVGGVVLALHGETQHGALVFSCVFGVAGGFRVFKVFFAIAAAVITAAVATVTVVTADEATAAGW
jgi:hypothetical protein